MIEGIKVGDLIRFKTEGKPPSSKSAVEVTGRSGRYAGWEVIMPGGARGVVLDNEIAEVIA